MVKHRNGQKQVPRLGQAHCWRSDDRAWVGVWRSVGRAWVGVSDRQRQAKLNAHWKCSQDVCLVISQIVFLPDKTINLRSRYSDTAVSSSLEPNNAAELRVALLGHLKIRTGYTCVRKAVTTASTSSYLGGVTQLCDENYEWNLLFISKSSLRTCSTQK